MLGEERNVKSLQDGDIAIVTDREDIVRRKEDHLKVVLGGGGVSPSLTTGFEAIRFEPCALPEMSLSEVDLATSFLGKQLAAPLIISSMTGGPDRSEAINKNLATAAQATGVALAVGSQRVALETGSAMGLTRDLRRVAPDILLLANLGGAQLAQTDGLSKARRAVEMIAADGLIIHLNALQEAVQPGGDTDWRGVLGAIEALVASLACPIVVKEVGFGLSRDVVKRLAAAGVAAVDVAGAGGTNWALVESKRTDRRQSVELAAAFADWGLPTARAIKEAREVAPHIPIIGSGGISTGLDVAKALRLGADVAGIAARILPAAVTSAEAAIEALTIVIEQLRATCFATGSRSLLELKRANLL